MSLSVIFSTTNANSMYWYNKSADLHASSAAMWFVMNKKDRIVVQEMNLGAGFDLSCIYPVYLMLCGLSLELALKALLVEQKKSPPTEHDLAKLSKEASFFLSPEEADAVVIYTEHILWAGKYPTTKNDATFKSYHADKVVKAFDTEILPGSTVKMHTQKEWFDWPNYEALWIRITNQYFSSREQNKLSKS